MEPVITYLRVSTQRQQRSGLGIKAQRTTIQQFVVNESLAIGAEFVESISSLVLSSTMPPGERV